MAQLNAYEQARIDQAEAMEAALRRGERTVVGPNGQTLFVTEGTVKAAQQIAENMRKNAAIRAEDRAERAAQEAAKQAKHEAARETELRAQLRSLFRGTDREFDAAYPELKQRWQIEQALNNDPVARKRASIYDGF